MNKKYFSILGKIALCATLSLSPSLAKATSDAEFINQLQRILKERPDLIMNVLRANSEAILDIAQAGSVIKRKRSMEAEWRNDLKEEKKINITDRPVWGAKDAPVTIIEFSDFTCPYCAQAAATLSELMKIYGDKINVVYKHTPLASSPIAVKASEYVIAAGYQSPELAHKLYEKLFAGRAELMEKGEAYIKDVAKELKLDVKKLTRDAKNWKTKKVLNEDLKDAKDLGIEGTPYFFVNNIVIRGAIAPELFKIAIDMALDHEKK